MKRLKTNWRFWKRLGLVVAIGAACFYLGPRFRVDSSIDRDTPLPNTTEIGDWISERERDTSGIRDGLEAKVVYAHEDQRKTKTSLV